MNKKGDPVKIPLIPFKIPIAI